MLRLKTYRKKGKCKAWGCSKPSQNPLSKDSLCYRCSHRLQALKNPLSYAYSYHKSNAKRRGIPYYLSFEDFKFFWTVLHPDAWEEKKKEIQSFKSRKIKGRKCEYEIDRINEWDGYWINRLDPSYTNIALCNKKLNAARSWDYRRRKMIFDIEVIKYRENSTEQYFESIPLNYE